MILSLSLFDIGVMTTPKRRILSFVFTVIYITIRKTSFKKTSEKLLAFMTRSISNGTTRPTQAKEQFNVEHMAVQ